MTCYFIGNSVLYDALYLLYMIGMSKRRGNLKKNLELLKFKEIVLEPLFAFYFDEKLKEPTGFVPLDFIKGGDGSGSSNLLTVRIQLLRVMSYYYDSIDFHMPKSQNILSSGDLEMFEVYPSF